MSSLLVEINIRLIEDNANLRHLKNLPEKKLCGRGVYLSEAQNPITPPPIHNVYVIAVNLFKGRGEGGELNQREG